MSKTIKRQVRKEKTKMKKSISRFFRRVVGEETGAVMMEYVILAVLIAAAAVVAIAYFGKTVTSEANVAATAMTGKGNSASDQQVSVQDAQKTWQKEAVDTNKKFSDAQEDAIADGAGSSSGSGGSGGGGS